MIRGKKNKTYIFYNNIYILYFLYNVKKANKPIIEIIKIM